MANGRNDEYWMRLALAQARRGRAKPGAGEVGCVIVRGGELLVESFNEAEESFDPTAHAEIVALRKLGRQMRSVDFHGCTLYCTLQCCGMCTMACLWAKISRVVYGARREDVHSLYFETTRFHTGDFIADAVFKEIEVTGGVLAEECAALYWRPGDQPPAEERKNE